MNAPKIDGRLLRKALTEDLRAAWEESRQLHPKEKPYAFIISGHEVIPRLTAHVLSKQSLDAAAQEYTAAGYYATEKISARELRYDVEASPRREEVAKLTATDEVLAPVAEYLHPEEAYKRIAEVAAKALQTLVEEELFGATPAARNRLVIAISTQAGTELMLRLAKPLNTETAAARLERAFRTTDVYKSASETTIAPDGSRLYYDARGDYEAATACTLDGLLLKKKWEHRYPGFGQSFTQFAVDPADNTLLGAKRVYKDDACEMTLFRYHPDKNRPVATAPLPGDFCGFALTADGNILVTGNSPHGEISDGYAQGMQVWDRDFNLLASYETGEVRQAYMLRSGELLVMRSDKLLRLHPRTKKVKAEFPLPFAHSFEVDADEKTLLLSRFYDLELPHNQQYETPFPLYLLKLPSLKPLRELGLPGHQHLLPALSADGTMASCFAARNQKQECIVVFDTKTGNVLLHRPSPDYLAHTSFHPQVPAVVVNLNGYVDKKKPPVAIWPVRKDG